MEWFRIVRVYDNRQHTVGFPASRRITLEIFLPLCRISIYQIVVDHTVSEWMDGWIEEKRHEKPVNEGIKLAATDGRTEGAIWTGGKTSNQWIELRERAHKDYPPPPPPSWKRGRKLQFYPGQQRPEGRPWAEALSYTEGLKSAPRRTICEINFPPAMHKVLVARI